MPIKRTGERSRTCRAVAQAPCATQSQALLIFSWFGLCHMDTATATIVAAAIGGTASVLVAIITTRAGGGPRRRFSSRVDQDRSAVVPTASSISRLARVIGWSLTVFLYAMGLMFLWMAVVLYYDPNGISRVIFQNIACANPCPAPRFDSALYAQLFSISFAGGVGFMNVALWATGRLRRIPLSADHHRPDVPTGKA